MNIIESIHHIFIYPVLPLAVSFFDFVDLPFGEGHFADGLAVHVEFLIAAALQLVKFLFLLTKFGKGVLDQFSGFQRPGLHAFDQFRQE